MVVGVMVGVGLGELIYLIFFELFVVFVVFYCWIFC